MRGFVIKQFVLLLLTNIASFYIGLNISREQFQKAKEGLLRKHELQNRQHLISDEQKINEQGIQKIVVEEKKEAPIVPKIAKESILRDVMKLKKKKSFDERLKSWVSRKLFGRKSLLILSSFQARRSLTAGATKRIIVIAITKKIIVLFTTHLQIS